jgi:site-specific DNA recombinase
MKRAVLYARVSTLAQGEEDKASIPEQVARIEEYCQNKGYVIVDRYIDIGFSGAKSKRPEFQRMLNDARSRKFDVIVCWKADRLSRGMYPAAALMEVIEPLDIKLEAVEEYLDMNWFAMLAVIGKMEIDSIKARTLMGRKARAKAGKLFSGKGNKLFGFTYEPSLGTRVVNEEEANIVKQIFYSYAEEYLTMQAICHRLMAQGILSPNGNKHWGTSTLHKILKNEAYIGRTFTFTQKHIKDGDTTRIQHKPREEWVEVEGATPAIIDRALFEKAELRLQRNKELALRNTKRDYLLRGFLYCSHCGKRYQGALKRYQTKGGIKEYLYYRCSSAFRVATNSCANPSWKAGQLEGIVWQQVSDVLANPEVVLAGLRAIQRDDANLLRGQLREIESRLKDLDSEQYELLDQSLRGFPREMIMRENEKINAKRSELCKRKAELESRIAVAKQTEVDIQGIKKACKIVKANLDELTLDSKRMALEALGIKVWLDNERVMIEGTIPVAYGAIASTPSN